MKRLVRPTMRLSMRHTMRTSATLLTNQFVRRLTELNTRKNVKLIMRRPVLPPTLLPTKMSVLPAIRRSALDMDTIRSVIRFLANTVPKFQSRFLFHNVTVFQNNNVTRSQSKFLINTARKSLTKAVRRFLTRSLSRYQGNNAMMFPRSTAPRFLSRFQGRCPKRFLEKFVKNMVMDMDMDGNFLTLPSNLFNYLILKCYFPSKVKNRISYTKENQI